MSPQSNSSSGRPLGTARGIIYGGVTVGVLDALAATLLTVARGRSPVRTWQGVASGLLGEASFDGGIPTMLVGLLVHFFIAFSVVTVYHLVSKRWAMLWRQPLIWGPVYGILVHLFMQHVVLALRFPDQPVTQLAPYIRQIIVHIICVGTPAALWARRAIDSSFGFRDPLGTKLSER